ncbi:MAG TPA: S8 family serine peptidase [Actinomycetota bacterium]|nr:S8 family serine peptidase [Actinomycetota bacterium]
MARRAGWLAPRFVLAVLLGALPSALLAAPAAAGPAGRPAPPPSLADRDGDGISDQLQAKLAGGHPSDRFDVVVTFTPRGSLGAAMGAVGPFEVRRQFAIVRGAAATMTAAQIRALAGRAGVFRIEEDVRVTVTLDAARRDFGADLAASTYGVTGSGVGICIVDTGVDPNHEQLDGGKVVAWLDLVNGRATPYDDHGHGTHVANIAAGDGVGSSADAARYRGVAPGASVYAVKALDRNGSGTESQIIDGIEWCGNQPGVRVLSMSLGTSSGSDGLDAMSQAVNNVVLTKGKVAVVAAGNSGDAPETVGSPGAAEQAITVGSVAEHSAPEGTPRHSHGIHLDAFSSRGPTLSGVTKPDVVAPGDRITAAAAGTVTGYATYSGTSMATPFVAGAVALALQASPGLGPSGVRSALEGTAEDWGPAGKDNDWGAGLVDVVAFLGQAAGAATVAQTPFPLHTRVAGSVPDDGLWTYEFSLGSDALGTPLAVTVTLDGEAVCSFFCLIVEWSPDLEARIVDPTGTVLEESTCPADEDCGIGRQETLSVDPTVAGTYRVEVYPRPDGPGTGGTFALDLSRAPVGAVPPPPPPGDTTPPAAPTGLTATGQNAKVALDWADNTEPDLAGYHVERSQDPPSASSRTWTRLTASPVGSSSYVDTAVVNGTTYYYRVRAVDTSGNESAPSEEASATPNPQVKGYAPSSVTVSRGSALGDPLSNLASSDDLYYRLASQKVGKKHRVDWYGEFVVDVTGVTKLTVSYEGHYSRTASQSLYVYNFDTGSWVRLESRNVGTTDTTSTYATAGNPDPYLSSDGRVRLRVEASASTSFTAYADRQRIAVEY